MAVEVGAGYVSIYPDTSSFKSEISKALEGDFSTGGQKASKGFFSAFDIGLGTFLGNMGTNLFGSMMGNMATAMNRLDTLTNYPKVMEGFGYSAEQAQESIELIMDRLVGLPTTTQEMVQFTQALADSTGDLDLATRGALAFNDAMLASGAPMADQTRAQRIFNRIVGSGTTTTQQWAAIMSVMPLQLGMTARALLGTSATAQDLGAALMNGQVSIEDILRAMVRLDEEGGEGMASFNEQAWNMAFTLETALKLIPIRISNALAAIGQELGRDNLMAPFLAIANGIKVFGDEVISGIRWVKDNFGAELLQIQGAAERVGSYLGTAFGTVWDAVKDFAAAAAPVILEFVNGTLNVLGDAFSWMADHGEFVSTALRYILTAFLAYKGAMFVQGVVLGIASALGVLVQAATVNPFGTLLTVITSVGMAIYTWITTTEEGAAVWQGFTSVIGESVAFIQDIFGMLLEYAPTVVAGIGTVALAIAGVAGAIDTAIAGSGAMVVAGTGLSNVFTQLWGVLSLNPLVSVGIAIAGVVAALATWFATTEEGKKAWENLCKTVLDFTEGLRKGIADAWNNIKKGLSDAWKNITKTASNAWKGLGNLAKSVFGLLAGSTLGIFDGMSKNLGTIWNGIKNTASTAWNGIKTLAGTVWDGIKSTITGMVDGAKTALGTAWENMKSTASTAWNNIKSTASTVWGNIKTTIGNLVDGIKSGAKGAWETMTSTAKGAWETMKSNASSIFGGIQSTLGGIWDKITGKTSTSVTSMQNSINSLKGKSVTVGVAKAGGFDGVIRSAQSAINSIQGRTVGINLNVYKTGISGLAVEQSYSGLGVSKVMTRAIMAKGGTIYEPTWALIGEAGYNETVIPNTPWGVRPLASMIAEEMGNTKSSGVVVTGNTFVVRNDQDITRVANQLNNMISRQTGGRL